MLTIDQFEELATLCRDDAERERFLRLLATAVEQQSDAFRLIITLRTDFEPQFTQEGSPLANLLAAAGPLRRAADGHRGPAPGDRGAGLGARALLRPAGAGG
ncbi:MAG: hypothetical protein IPO15_23910 [Anaerolineae bacterium]|nr:hypothetical protein [Anaerolineae bacterium]